MNFTWENYAKELCAVAPTLWAVLQAATASLGTKYKRKDDSVVKQRTTCVLAAAIVSKEHNMHMSSIQHIISLLLWNGNTTTMVGISCMFIVLFLVNKFVAILTISFVSLSTH